MSTWRQQEGTRPGGYGWTALSSLHCCRSCSCAERGTVTSSSSSTVSRQCCHTSSQQVTTIMPATCAGMCDRWSTFPTVPRRTYWQVHTFVGTRMGDRSASRSVRRADIYQAKEGFWRYEGHFNEPEQVAVWVNSFSVCAHLDIAMEHVYTVK